MKKTSELILTLPLLRGCLEKTVQAIVLMEKDAVKTFAKGEPVLFDSGGLDILLSGKLKIGGRTDKKKLLLSELKPGAVFGYASLFESGKHFETDISAAVPSKVLHIPEKTVETLLGSDARFARNIISAQSEKIRFLNEKVLSFTSPDASEKLMRYLAGLEKDENGRVKNELGMAPLSARLGMGRASLYRAFEKLEKEKKIIRDGKAVILPVDRDF